MKINLKEVSVFLSAILLAGSYAVAQNPYRWTDELELLKRVDKLPEYRTGSYVEQFSSYDRTRRQRRWFCRVLILSSVRKGISW